MQHNPARRRAFAGPRRWHTQAADVTLGVGVRFADKVAAAFGAFGGAQQVGVDELHQAPGAGDREQRLHAADLSLLHVELEGFHDEVNVFKRAGLAQVFVDRQKQRGMNVRLPGQEPVG